MMLVPICPLHPHFDELKLGPRRMSEHAAGFDIAAAVEAPVVIGSGARALIPCGFAMALPAGYEAQVRPRSGLALKHGVTVLNAPGTIDADYRGEVKVILVNHGEVSFVVRAGERIAQLVISQVCSVQIQIVTDLENSCRGAAGFGSTG